MDLADARRAPGGGGRSLGARPLRGYFIVMVAVIAATYLLIPLLSKWAGVETGSGIGWVLANKTILFTVAFGMAGFLVVTLRQKPKEVFLTPGDLRAPTSVRLPGMRRPLHWGALGTIATVLLFTGFATQMWLDGAFPEDWLQRLLPAAPLVLASAVFNAFGEEVIFRSGGPDHHRGAGFGGVEQLRQAGPAG